jgi:hypothetical protein
LLPLGQASSRTNNARELFPMIRTRGTIYPSVLRRRAFPAFLIALSMAAAVVGCATPRMIAPEDQSAFYARASSRMGQEGTVVLHFSIGPDGKAMDPILHDEPVIVVDEGVHVDDRAGARLIESAERYIRAAKFDARAIHKRRVTASFVFELKPCGTLKHSPVHDYAINQCRERERTPAVNMSSLKAAQ